MEEATDLDYYRKEPDLLCLKIASGNNMYQLNGFESMFLNNVDEVVDSDFEDNEIYFRDQPSQKLIMSKTGEGVLELNIRYQHRERNDVEIKVEKEKFEKFLKEIREGLTK